MSDADHDTPNENVWQVWIPRLYRLQGDKRARQERVHNPALLLALIDIFDREDVVSQTLALRSEVRSAFRMYFDNLRQADDRNKNFWTPVNRLCELGFWSVAMERVGSEKSENDVVAGEEKALTFQDDFWRLVSNPFSRRQVRQLVIARYFPWKRRLLQSFNVIYSADDAAVAFQNGMVNNIRGQAFSELLLEIYDHRCTACGAPAAHGQINLVTHIIPFEIAYNDHPTNGLVLCPSHYSAFKANLIAAVPGASPNTSVWTLNPMLRRRKTLPRWVADLDGSTVIAPFETKYRPALASLEWSRDRIACAPIVGIPEERRHR